MAACAAMAADALVHLAAVVLLLYLQFAAANSSEQVKDTALEPLSVSFERHKRLMSPMSAVLSSAVYFNGDHFSRWRQAVTSNPIS